MFRSAIARGGTLTRSVADRSRGALGLCLTLALAACASPGPAPDLSQITPLHLEGRSLHVQDAGRLAGTPDLLALDAEMRAFVQLYTGDLGSARQRLHMLHRAVKSPAVLDMQYDPGAEGSAIETFHRGSANCLSFANMFVALARAAGLNAGYQWLEVRPQWSRLGERVAVSLHVNVVVETRRGEEFMVDIDPLQSRDVAGSRRLSDADARALYHNNIAMSALAESRTGEAWLQLVRALQLSPRMTHLWVNLGAVYRIAGQHRDAERSYLQALDLDPGDRSAMTNLVILYRLEGREEDRAYWASRVERYRQANPYYHAWLGERAAEEDDWQAARAHFERALKLSPGESHLLYATGLVYYQLEDLDAASRYITQAIETASLVRDRENYQTQLEALQRERGAGS